MERFVEVGGIFMGLDLGFYDERVLGRREVGIWKLGLQELKGLKG